jgi:hypothetical protein
MTTLAGSTSGIGGIVVRPAPRRADRRRSDPDRTRWVTPVPARWEPMAAEASLKEPEPVVTGSSAGIPVTGAAPAGVPHTSQYPSTIVPGQPGCWHLLPSDTTGAPVLAGAAPPAGGMPQTSQ